MEENQESDLILKNRGIKNMKKDIQINLINIRNLDLSRNKIENVENLKNAEKLKRIILNENEIKILDGKELPKKIKEFFLNENQIEKISLKNFENMKILSLCKNKIKKIEFFNLKNLKYLDLSKNQIETTEKQNFNNLKNLKELNLSFNKIECISFFDIHDKLQKLDLSNNIITKINKKIILENLKILDLSNNKIKNIKNFDCIFPNLEILNLKNNLIGELIDIYAIDKMYKLKEIYIKYNNLYYEGIHEFILRLNTNLSVIDDFKKNKIHFEISETKNNLKKFFTNEEIEEMEKEIDNNLDVFLENSFTKDEIVFDENFNNFISSFNDNIKINQKLIKKNMNKLEGYFNNKRKQIMHKENVYNENYSNLRNGKKVNFNKKNYELTEENLEEQKKLQDNKKEIRNKSNKKLVKVSKQNIKIINKPDSLKYLDKNIKRKKSEKKKILLRRNKDHKNFMKCFQIKNNHPNSLKKQNEFLKKYLQKKK